MVINTPYGNSGPRIDGYEIRSAAVAMNIPCVTTVQGASAAVQGIEAGIRGDIGVMSLQELHSALGAPYVSGVRGAAGRGDGRAGVRCALASTRIPNCCGMGPARRRRRAAARSATSASRPSRISPSSSRRWRSSRRYGAAGYRGARAHHRRAAGRRACWCWPTPSAATSAPRWRPTPTAWAGDSPLAVRRGDGLAVPGLRLAAAACSTPPPRTAAGSSCWPRRPTPRARACSAPTIGRADRRAVDRRRRRGAENRSSERGFGRRRRRRDRCRPARSECTRRPGAGAGRRRAGWSARGARRPRRCGSRARVLPAVSREVLRAGPDVGGAAGGGGADARRGRVSGPLSRRARCRTRSGDHARRSPSRPVAYSGIQMRTEPEAPALTVARRHRVDLLAVPVERLVVLRPWSMPRLCQSTGPLSLGPPLLLSLARGCRRTLLCWSCPHGGRPARCTGRDRRRRAEADAEQSGEADSGSQCRCVQARLKVISVSTRSSVRREFASPPRRYEAEMGRLCGDDGHALWLVGCPVGRLATPVPRVRTDAPTRPTATAGLPVTWLAKFTDQPRLPRSGQSQ